MLLKLIEWYKNTLKQVRKNDLERYLDESVDIHDLESRINSWNRQNHSLWSDRYY